MAGRHQVTAAFDEAADGYDAHGVTFFTTIAARLTEAARISPGARVLDAGCGAGAALVRVAAAVAAGSGAVPGTAGHVVGIDVSAGMLRRSAAACAASGIRNVALVRADAEQPPFAPDTFDAVVASMMVFVLPDPARAVRAWHAILKPGGTLAFSWNIAEDPRWIPVVAAVDSRVPGGRGLEHQLRHGPFGSVEDVEAMAVGAGFGSVTTRAADVVSRYSGPAHWWAVSWSQAPRITWQHIPPADREPAREEAFGLLEALREPDGTLLRPNTIGFTTARKASGRRSRG